jgi:hypothetical protein
LSIQLRPIHWYGPYILSCLIFFSPFHFSLCPGLLSSARVVLGGIDILRPQRKKHKRGETDRPLFQEDAEYSSALFLPSPPSGERVPQ